MTTPNENIPPLPVVAWEEDGDFYSPGSHEKHGYGAIPLCKVSDAEAYAAQDAAVSAVPVLASSEFIQRTNEEYSAWCKTHYQPDALDERGMVSLHGLWAWQEQERRAAIARQKAAHGITATPQTAQPIQLEGCDERWVLIYSLVASKGWNHGYAAAFVDDYTKTRNKLEGLNNE